MDTIVGLKMLEIGTFLSVASLPAAKRWAKDLSTVSKPFHYSLRFKSLELHLLAQSPTQQVLTEHLRSGKFCNRAVKSKPCSPKVFPQRQHTKNHLH